ncbi:PP2C family protein-serine/threonine phosphatase [Kineococcus sp. SYSU DK001]|uniref:PP2C family protein-serine/threonine phosphatase n=1 Tax=Kineococcus sp. SYSU DK001 TaxID=3383122 RepID=UPI003D7E2F59
MSGPEDVDVAAARLLGGLLRRAHLSTPADLPDVVVEEARTSLGASEVVVSLVNHEFTALVPVPSRLSPHRPPQPLEGSMAGRAFTSSTTVFADAPADAPADGTAGGGAGGGAGGDAREPRQRMWVPLLDGSDRLGVLEMTLPAPGGRIGGELLAVCERYTHLVAQSVVSKGLYGDVFERVRRTRPMTVASQLLHSMLPPLLYATDGLVVAGMLEPAYDNGGDAFDYAVNRVADSAGGEGDVVHLAILDGMGHGLAAAGVTTYALAAYRQARIAGLDLVRTCTAMSGAVFSQFGGDRHVTAVLAELELATGRLSWVSAGHPPPLLLRGARVVKHLTAPACFPLGWDFGGEIAVAQESLQPGDAVLLYTDGLIEARRADRSFLGVEGLAGFLEQEAAADQLAPETLRRMRRAVLAHQDGVLQDDASALLVQWRSGAEDQLLPQTVQ